MAIFASSLRARAIARRPTHHRYYFSYPTRSRLQCAVSRRNYVFDMSRICLPVMGSLSCQSIATRCEAPLISESVVSTETIVLQETSPVHETLKQRILRIFRLWKRFIKLFITLTPVAALYPIQKLLKSTKSSDDDNAPGVVVMDTNEVDGPLGWYLNMCLYCVECSGAAVVKLMQWAGSRPDLFGREFCAVFSRLQDDTTPHSWRHTERVMKEAYGNDWKDKIRLGKVIGSGCIGQVYDGMLKDADGNEQRVAVKGSYETLELCLWCFFWCILLPCSLHNLSVTSESRRRH